MWNKKEHQKKMQKSVDIIISYFSKKGITFSPTDGDLENVVFTSNLKQVKISHHSFYRYSGIACFTKDGKEKNTIEEVIVTDFMWLDIFIKPIIELLFEKQ